MATQNQTQIVNVKVQNIRPEYKNLKEWMEDDNNVYIGRSGIVFIEGKRFPPKKSIWANPFKVQNNRNETVIQLYEKYIRDKIENEYGVDELLKLQGKTLGCWCKPKSCHGDVLLKLIKEYSVFSCEETESNYESDNESIPICLCCEENEIETRCNFCEQRICSDCKFYCNKCDLKCCPVCISDENMCEMCSEC